MLKLYSNLVGQKVVSFQEETKIACFEDLVVKAENAQVLGAFVRQKSLLKSKRKLIVLTDVLEFSNAIYVQGTEVLLEPNELIRTPNLEDRYFPLIDLPVTDTDGNKLGKVIDYVFETLSGQIVKFHVQPNALSFHKEHRIIPRSKIHSLSAKKLVISDAAQKAKAELESLLELDPAFSRKASFSTKTKY